MNMMEKMESFQQMAKQLPGVAQKCSQEELDKAEQEIRRSKVIISSMTNKERKYPCIINASRKKRIAAGSGVSTQQVDFLIKQFEELKRYAKMMKRFGGLGKLFS